LAEKHAGNIGIARDNAAQWLLIAKQSFADQRFHRALLASRRCLSLTSDDQNITNDILHIYAASCRTLCLSHSHGIISRDIKGHKDVE
jgi:hypothetical protein